MVGPWGVAVSCCQAETLYRKCTCVNQVVFSDTLQAAGSRCTSVLLLQCFVPVHKSKELHFIFMCNNEKLLILEVVTC